MKPETPTTSHEESPHHTVSHEEDYSNEKQATFTDSSADVAAQLVDNAIAGSFTEAEERSLVRRVDMFLMPVMFLSMAFSYLDKACLTGAALFGILTDLKLIDV